MTTGLQTAPLSLDTANVPAPGVDNTSLKALARMVGITALAGGGATLLLYNLLRPKPEYEPTGSDRVVRSQSTENALPLKAKRTALPLGPELDTAEVESDEVESGATEQDLNAARQLVQPSRAGAAEFVDPEFSEAGPLERRRPGRQQRRPGDAERRAGGYEGGQGRADDFGEDEFSQDDWREEVGDQGEETGRVDAAERGARGDTSSEDRGPVGASDMGAGANALDDHQGNVGFDRDPLDAPQDDLQSNEGAQGPADVAEASEAEAGADEIDLDGQIARILDGPLATLEELPLLQEQADTLPAIPPQETIAAAQPAPKDGIYVENFVITGNRVIPTEKLAQIAREAVFPDAAETKDGQAGSQVGMVLSPAELVQASDAITAFYADQGYVNSGAYVPEAVLQGGPPEIRVIEGKLESINVNVEPANGFGLARPMSEGYVEGRLAQAGSGTLNLNRLVDGVRLLELDPLIESISTELIPGSVTGSSILNVNVKQAQGFAGGVTLNNYRSPSIGSFAQGVSLQQSNIIRTGDSAQVGYSRSSGSNSLDLGYSVPINAKDGTISLRHSRNSSKVVEEPFSALEAISKSRLTELKLRQPLVKKPDEELAASLTLSRYFSRGRLNDGDFPLTSDTTNEEGETRVSALRFGQEWTKKGEKQFIELQSQFSLGLGSMLGGDVRRDAPDSRFLSWRGKGRLVRSLGPDAIASLKGEVQLSPTSLVPVERFSIGGPTTVRGYRQNTLLTDGGWLMSAEAQVPVMRFPKWKSVVQLAPFVDMGGGWNMGREQPEQSFLASTGVGAILRVGDDFSARVDYGIPITGRESDGSSLQDSGISFSINLTPF